MVSRPTFAAIAACILAIAGAALALTAVVIATANPPPEPRTVQHNDCAGWGWTKYPRCNNN